jgi:hypothetical protein
LPNYAGFPGVRHIENGGAYFAQHMPNEEIVVFEHELHTIAMAV